MVKERKGERVHTSTDKGDGWTADSRFLCKKEYG